MDPLPDQTAPPSPRWAPRAGPLLLLVLTFFSLCLILLWRHELWQDEWQAWLIARESPSLRALFQNLRYEGHPCLWYCGLFLVSRLTTSPLGMQVLHLIIATCSVYVFLKYSPFTRTTKLLFIFGYFPCYEYAVLSRSYALSVLGLFSFCALFCRPPPPKFSCSKITAKPENPPGANPFFYRSRLTAHGSPKYLLLALIIFLLCQTSVYGLIIALVLGAILLWTVARDRSAGIWRTGAVFVLVLLGVGLAVLQLIPPADSGVAVGWRFAPDLPHLTRTLAAVWRSYVPVPAPAYHFWNTNVIPDPGWQALLSLILLAFGLLLFIRQPVPLFLYAVGTLGILAFTYSKYPGSIRHHGHLFLLFIASLWLSSACPTQRKISSRIPTNLIPNQPILPKSFPNNGIIQAMSDLCRSKSHLVLTILLAAHLLAGIAAASLDLVFPFSASREAAGFIQHHHLDRLVILGHADDAASAVAGCLGRRIYYPASRCWGSFVIWNQARKPNVPPGELLHQAAELSRQHQQAVLLILNDKLPPGRFPVILLQQFTHSLVPTENYYLYLLPE